MKKLFTLIAATLCLTTAANAQRLIDLEFTRELPAANTAIDSGVTFNTKVIVKNLSTTPLKTSDSVIYSIYFGQWGLVFPPDQTTTIFFKTNKMLNQNDTMQIVRSLSIGYNTPTNNDSTVNFCIIGAVLNRSADSAKDPATATNNQACKSVIRKAQYNPLNVVDLSNTVNSVAVYPNPASNNVTFAVNAIANTTANISITDVAGRVLVNEHMNVTNGMNKLPVSTQQLANGMYLYRVELGGESVTGKLLIAK